MTEHQLETVRVATTPAQAKLFVALLQAEGIPAFVEGDGLADEVATSRRLMNLAGTHVKVPAAALQRATEVLDREAVPDDELEAQALAAGDAEEPPLPRSAPLPRTVFVLLGALAGGAVAWLARDALEAPPRNAYFDYELTDSGVREIWRRDPRHYTRYVDRDGDGFHELIETHGVTGAVITSTDLDRDGRYELHSIRDADGTEAQWRETEGADFLDEAVVRDAGGDVLQRIRWVAGRGYELLPR